MTGHRMVKVGLMTLAAVTLAGTVASAQGLADVARKEEERRKALGKPATKQGQGKVYTNDNLNPDFTEPVIPATPATPAGAAAGGTKAAGASDKATPAAGDPASTGGENTGGNPNIKKVDINDRGEKYWRDKTNTIRTAIENAQKEVSGFELRLQSLSGDPAEQKVTQQLLTAARANVASLQGEWDNFQAVAKSANIPAAWVQ